MGKTRASRKAHLASMVSLVCCRIKWVDPNSPQLDINQPGNLLDRMRSRNRLMARLNTLDNLRCMAPRVIHRARTRREAYNINNVSNTSHDVDFVLTCLQNQTSPLANHISNSDGQAYDRCHPVIDFFSLEISLLHHGDRAEDFILVEWLVHVAFTWWSAS